LIERLKKRNTESDKELSKRIERMEMEFGMKSRFDYVIKNETGTEGVNKSVEQLKKILKKYINN